MEAILLCVGTGAFFLVGLVNEFMSTHYSRSVARDKRQTVVLTSMLIEGWRVGAPLITMLFPGDGWIKGFCVAAYIVGVGVGAHLAMSDIREMLQRGKALMQW